MSVLDQLPESPQEETNPLEGEVSPESIAEGQRLVTGQRLAELDGELRANQEDPADTIGETETPPASEDEEVPQEELGFLDSISAYFERSKSGGQGAFLAAFSTLGFAISSGATKFWSWLKGSSEDEEEPAPQQAQVEPVEQADSSSELKVKSWEEVQAISDLGERVAQAALFAYETDMDCFTRDGNHCSAWCDSVFNKAGLGGVYKQEARVFCDGYEDWPRKGTRQGLKLEPGDSIIRYNGNESTEHHQEIILSSKGPDSAGNYEVRTVGQTSVQGSSGTREIRSLTIKGEDIRVVVRPGASDLVS